MEQCKEICWENITGLSCHAHTQGSLGDAALISSGPDENGPHSLMDLNACLLVGGLFGKDLDV